MIFSLWPLVGALVYKGLKLKCIQPVIRLHGLQSLRFTHFTPLINLL